jgi:hypothetical protein
MLEAFKKPKRDEIEPKRKAENFKMPKGRKSIKRSSFIRRKSKRGVGVVHGDESNLFLGF